MCIGARGIAKSYSRKGGRVTEALKPTNIEIKSGRLTVIFGRSGSGKTTLINILSGLLKPDSGSVIYEERSIYTMTDGELSQFRSKNIGVIPQGQSAVSVLNVKENVLLQAAVAGNENASDRAAELLREVGLSELSEAYPAELSGGEARRLAIARALINSPSAVYADEPTNDLDDENTRLVFRLLKEAAAKGAAVAVVTHDISAAEYADIIYRMDGGELTIERGE